MPQLFAKFANIFTEFVFIAQECTLLSYGMLGYTEGETTPDKDREITTQLQYHPPPTNITIFYCKAVLINFARIKLWRQIIFIKEAKREYKKV